MVIAVPLVDRVSSPTRNRPTQRVSVAEVDDNLFSFSTSLFHSFLIPCTAEEAAASRDVIEKEGDSPERSKKRRRHRHRDDSDEDPQSRSPSRSRSRARSDSPSDRDDPPSDPNGHRHHRGGSNHKRHRTDVRSSKKYKHRDANRSRSRSRSPVHAENYGSGDPGAEERKETEEEYDARLEREETERIAAEKRKRLEALKARHERDLETQNAVRFKGTQMVPLLLV